MVEFYTKAGDITTYHSLMILVPDYNITITLLNGGPINEIGGGNLQVWFSNIVQELLPALEQAGKDEAEKKYGGTYSDAETESSITLSVDDEPGFKVTNWTANGVDIAKTYLSFALPPQFPTPEGLIRFRLYPTGLKTDTETSWRVSATAGTEEDVAAADSIFAWPDASCVTWASMDRIVYQLLAQDHFVFTETGKGSERRAEQLELVGYRVNLTRED